MAKRYFFPELECCNCPHIQYVGRGLCQTRYCNGFPKKKKPKRFRSSDPQFKAPKWCPRRLTPPICRIYGFADEHARELDALVRNRFDPKKDDYIYVTASHYKLRLELPLGMKAKAFYERFRHRDMNEFFETTDLQLGEVIEIDDGLKPYYFYSLNWSRVIPMFHFNLSQVRKAGDDYSG